MFAGILLLSALYLGNLTGMGLILPDEPRYADIGRAMARTGDWVTPRLWGVPWFEKPALLYWMTGLGFRMGLGPETAPRLPVALLGLSFLLFFWLRLRKLWDATVASYATAVLATSAGWLAYSHVAVTDIPMAVLFSSALLLSIPEKEDGQVNRTAIAALLALATLAKSLPPLVLFFPVVALDYRRLRLWLRPAPLAVFALVTLPWHILCGVRNGSAFWRVLFVEHQFGRFTSTAMQHVQPFWYYLPVLLLLLYPWFPLLLCIPRKSGDLKDYRLRILVAVVGFGFLFLSAARNKLPSYLLPLLPALCILIGLGVSRSRWRNAALVPCAALLGLLPAAAGVLPAALSAGIRSAQIPFAALALWLAAGLGVGAALTFAIRRKSLFAIAALTSLFFLWFQFAVFPGIDQAASGRPLWNAGHPACAPPLRRTILYSLYYYAGRELPACGILDQSALHVVR